MAGRVDKLPGNPTCPSPGVTTFELGMGLSPTRQEASLWVWNAREVCCCVWPCEEPTNLPGTPQHLHLGAPTPQPRAQEAGMGPAPVLSGQKEHRPSLGGLNPQGQKALGNPVSAPQKQHFGSGELLISVMIMKNLLWPKGPQAPPIPCLLAL